MLERSLVEKNEARLRERSEKKALGLFHAAAERVPAYRAFLKTAKINHTRVKTIKDFASVPTTDAKNYIARYPIQDRCWDGNLSGAQLIATSSGTTGEPKYWPRSIEQDLEAAVVHRFLYKEYFGADAHSTLFLIGFPMGIYISGMATVLPSWLTSFKNKKMTIMCVGNNKKEMLRAAENLSGEYEQTVLIGHPFFIKDVIETGVREGVAWSKKNLGLMFCSEGFTEEWRSYIAERAGIRPGAMRIFNTYGSSEMLLMGYETRFSIEIKKRAEKNQTFLSALTGDVMPPQLFQFNPFFRYIESIDRELIFSSASGIPLIKFNLHDRGEVRSFEEVRQTLQTFRFTPVSPIKRAHPLPFVALWGRTDQTIKFHGVNIYPEHIEMALMEKPLMRLLTGKFVIRKFLDRGMDQRWEINIELSQGARSSAPMARNIQTRIIEKLGKINLEYLDMSSHIKKDVRPVIKLWPYQDANYFKQGLKPHYIENKK
jgi:phenylacetate-CoA ligase